MARKVTFIDSVSVDEEWEERCYGFFVCDDCDRPWESAQVYCTRSKSTGLDPTIAYGQKCKSCKARYILPHHVEELQCSKCKQPLSQCMCPKRKLACSCCHKGPRSCKCEEFVCKDCKKDGDSCRCEAKEFLCSSCERDDESCRCEVKEFLCESCRQVEDVCQCEELYCRCCRKIPDFCKCGNREFRCTLCHQEDTVCECKRPCHNNPKIPHKISLCEKCQKGYYCVQAHVEG